MVSTPRLHAVRRVVQLAPPAWGRFALGIGLSMLTLLCGIGLLTVAGALISKAALRPPVLSLGVLIVGVRFFGLSRACLRYAERLVSHDVAFRALAGLRERFFARLVPVLGDDTPVRQGELLSRFVVDVDALQHLYLRAGGPPLAALATSSVAVAVAWLILPLGAVILATGLAVAGIVLPAAAARIGRSASRRQAAARATLTTEVLEVVQGGAELVAAGRAGERRARCASADARLQALAARDAVASASAVGAGSFLQGATALAVAVVAVGAVDAGRLDGILLAALTFLALASFEAVAPLPAAAQHLDACAASAERLLDVTEAEPSVREPASPRPTPRTGPLVLHDAAVTLDGVPVLRGANLCIEPGRTVALLGPSGAGKTTLAHLLVRFRDPDRGAVTLGGVDVRALRQAELREQVCLIAQDARLFTTTVAENVRLARPNATDAAVGDALEQAGLGPWLSTAGGDGLHTMVGEDGALLSGGQRQRIALARGLLADARFLVLDEPTAHIDPQGARALLSELPRLAAGRGVLAIVHDRSGLEAFDAVLELREGRVLEDVTTSATRMVGEAPAR